MCKARRFVLAVLLASCTAGGGCSMLPSSQPRVSSFEYKRTELTPVAETVLEERPVERKPPALSLETLSPDRVKQQIDAVRGKGPDGEKAKEIYLEADVLFREASELDDPRERRQAYAAAAGRYAEAAKRWPDSALEIDALFMRGEAFFFAEEYPEASETFEKLLKQFPNNRHLDRIQARRFAIADYWLKFDKIDPQAFYEVNLLDGRRPWRDVEGEALRVFDRIRIDDPTGKLADDATMALANSFFDRGKYERAAEHYADLRSNFPNSDHQFLAHFLGLQAVLRSYQGPEYSGAPLETAEKLIEQLRRQFPVEAEREREFLAKAYAEVRFKQAEREWSTARYFDRRHEFGAARFYYDLIARDFADTPYADESATRVAELRDEPATPPQRLSWLVNLFPEDEVVKPLMTTGASGTYQR